MDFAEQIDNEESLADPSIGRLSYLNRQSKPAPTRNYGSEDARARALRRRVGLE